MSTGDPRKPLIFVHTAIRTPPVPVEIRKQAGAVLSVLQDGVSPGLPLVRMMPKVARGLGEIRLSGPDGDWRLMFAILPDVIAVLHIFPKKTQKTPKEVFDLCKRRIAELG